MELTMENQDSKSILEKLARDRVNKLKKFYTHLFIYVIGIVFYILKTYFNVPFNFLPLRYINEFVMWVWTFFLVVQGIQVFFAEKIFGSKWEQKQIDKILEKEKTSNNKWE
jgi:uncharacterized protein YacL